MKSVFERIRTQHLRLFGDVVGMTERQTSIVNVYSTGKKRKSERSRKATNNKIAVI